MNLQGVAGWASVTCTCPTLHASDSLSVHCTGLALHVRLATVLLQLPVSCQTHAYAGASEGPGIAYALAPGMLDAYTSCSCVQDIDNLNIAEAYCMRLLLACWMLT